MAEEIISNKTIRVKYHADIDSLEQIEQGDWIDLRTGEDCYLSRGEFKTIPLGVSIELPAGYEALVAPRSSTFKKYGLLQTNSVGIIDESYCGNEDEWMFPAYATKDIVIKKNTRIAQFRVIRHQPPLSFETVDSLQNENRGGFGSTGDI